MATLTQKDLQAIHETIVNAIPEGAVYYCVIFNPDDGAVAALDNAEDPQDIREVARNMIEHELANPPARAAVLQQ